MSEERNKVVANIKRIAENYHLAPIDGELREKYFPHNLAFLALSYVLNANHVLIGDPGWGKTTGAQLVSSVFSGVPYDLTEALTIEGHPGLFTEKWLARPDYGALAKAGTEKVIWQGGFGLDSLIVNEITRIPLDVQAEMLEGIRTGRWKYLNEQMYEGKKPTFATMNYRDNGTSDLLAPLEDRLDIITEEVAGSPLENYEAAEALVEKDLVKPEITEKALGLILKQDFRAFHEHLNRDESRIPGYITSEEKKKIRGEINALRGSWSNDARYFLWTLAAEINFSRQYGTKRTRDPISQEDHDKLYLGVNVKNSFSPRPMTAARRFAQGLAWLLGENTVELDHIRYVLPHIMAHKMRFTDAYRNLKAGIPRTTYDDLHLAQQLVVQCHESYNKSVKPLQNMVHLLQTGKVRALPVSSREQMIEYEEDGKLVQKKVDSDFDHPLIRHLIKKKLFSRKCNL